jgi:hypothetical protein
LISAAATSPARALDTALTISSASLYRISIFSDCSILNGSGNLAIRMISFSMETLNTGTFLPLSIPASQSMTLARSTILDGILSGGLLLTIL